MCACLHVVCNDTGTLQALTSVITDPLGTPLFNVRMAAAGLPVTATIKKISDFWGDSITDQVIPAAEGSPPLGWLQMAGLLIGIGALAAIAAAISVAFRKRRAATARQQALQTTPRLTRNTQLGSGIKAAKVGDSDIEMAGACCSHGSVTEDQLQDEPLNPYPLSEDAPLLLNHYQQQQWQSVPSNAFERQAAPEAERQAAHGSGRQLASGAERLTGDLQASSYYPFREDSCSIQRGQLGSRNCSSNSSSDHSLSLSPVEFSSLQRQLHLAQGQSCSEQSQLLSPEGHLAAIQGQLQGPEGALPLQAWVIDPTQIEICQHPRGGDWQLGAGSFGVVSFLLPSCCMYCYSQNLRSGHTHCQIHHMKQKLLELDCEAGYVKPCSFLGMCLCFMCLTDGLVSAGQVYKARKGMQDVAVKTIHSRLVSPHVPASEAADNIDRVSLTLSFLS